MGTLLDITLNIITPLLIWIAGGVYVYRTGAFVRGIFLTWGLLAGYNWLSFITGEIVSKFDHAYSGYFQDGRSAFVATTVGGALYGLTVSLTAILIRNLVNWIKKVGRGV